MSLNCVERAPNSESGVPFVLLSYDTFRHAQEERVIVKLVPILHPNPQEITLNGHVYLTDERLVVLTDRDTIQPAEYDNFYLDFFDIISHKLQIPYSGSHKYRLSFRVICDHGLDRLYNWHCTIEFPYGGAKKFQEEFNKAYNESMLPRRRDC